MNLRGFFPSWGAGRRPQAPGVRRARRSSAGFNVSLSTKRLFSRNLPSKFPSGARSLMERHAGRVLQDSQIDNSTSSQDGGLYVP
jgi:hypothetical protein